MKEIRAALLAVLAVLSFGAVARADTAVANLNYVPAGPAGITKGHSHGEVIFTLADNGQINASVNLSDSQTLSSVAFDSSATLNISDSNPVNGAEAGPLTAFDSTWNSNFYCPGCGASETFTIGNPGEFTSAYQALGGGLADFDFFVDELGGGYLFANVTPASAAPEPSAWALILAGVAMVGAALRFNRRRFVLIV